jgi:tetratricopeptide (TPR) repeat protein
MPKLSTFLVALAVVTGGAALTAPAHAFLPDEQNETASNPDYGSAVRAVKKKDYRGAIGYLTRVLDDEPKNADALNFMGYSHRKLGDFKNAIAYYTRALAIDPDHRGANEYLGEAYLEINDLPKAQIRLARLSGICGMGCEEYRELSALVQAYKAKRRPNQSSRRRW